MRLDYTVNTVTRKVTICHVTQLLVTTSESVMILNGFFSALCFEILVKTSSNASETSCFVVSFIFLSSRVVKFLKTFCQLTFFHVFKKSQELRLL